MAAKRSRDKRVDATPGAPEIPASRTDAEGHDIVRSEPRATNGSDTEFAGVHKAEARRPKGPSYQKAEAEEIRDFIIEHYGVTKAPIFLAWRTTVNAFYAWKYPGSRPHLLAEYTAHHHLTTIGRMVKKMFESNPYQVTCVPVSKKIYMQMVRKDNEDVVVSGLKNRGRPDLTSRWNTEFYERCIPVAGDWTIGYVLFPRDQCRDHPLLITYLSRRGNASATYASNTIGAVRRASDVGVISNDNRDKISEHIIETVRHAREDDPHPLFRDMDKGTANNWMKAIDDMVQRKDDQDATNVDRPKVRRTRGGPPEDRLDGRIVGSDNNGEPDHRSSQSGPKDT